MGRMALWRGRCRSRVPDDEMLRVPEVWSHGKGMPVEWKRERGDKGVGKGSDKGKGKENGKDGSTGWQKGYGGKGGGIVKRGGGKKGFAKGHQGKCWKCWQVAHKATE